MNTISSLDIAAKAARQYFIEEMKADNATQIAFGATIMTREQWSLWLSLAVARVVAEADSKLALVDILNHCFASDLGNVSQLCKALEKEKVIFIATAGAAAGSLAERLAKRAAAVNPPATPAAPVSPPAV